jgi:hypothetical protein
VSGNRFVGDHVLLDVSFDAARRQLRRLASDGLLLGASEYAYRAAITGLAEEAGPTAALSQLLGCDLEALRDPHQRCGVTEPEAREPGKGTRGGEDLAQRERHPPGRWQLPR